MMRERWIWKAVNCLYLTGAALAEEMLVHFSGILKDPCLAHRLRAPIPWRHLASFIEGGHYPCRSAR